MKKRTCSMCGIWEDLLFVNNNNDNNKTTETDATSTFTPAIIIRDSVSGQPICAHYSIAGLLFMLTDKHGLTPKPKASLRCRSPTSPTTATFPSQLNWGH